MKFAASDSLDRLSVFLFLTAAIVFTAVAIFVVYEQYNEYLGRKNYPLVKREFNQIEPLTGAIPASEIGNTVAWHSATVGRLYRTNLSYSEVKTYFDTELSKHGFKLEKESEVYGRKRALYKKDELTAFIDYTDIANPEYTYYFYVSWGS
jgi:hypothetical protein